MSIARLQRRDTEVGRIRLGKKTASGQAGKLDTFRFTSADEAMITEIAALYGGTPAPWMNDKKRQFEVITETSVIPVYIPPQTIDPWYEQWGGSVCQRRCDGIRDVIHDRPCDCTFDSFDKPSKCKPTTRVSLYLAEIPGMGTWRLETHGIYAAGELVQLSERIHGIQVPLPARLALEQRGRKFFNREKGRVETLEYPVPVLWLDSVTSRHIAVGQDAVSQVVRAAAAGQLPAAETPALAAAPAGPPPDPEMVARALAQIATATPDQMPDLDLRIKKVGSPPELLAAFQLRLGELEVERRQDDQFVHDQILEVLRTAAPEEMNGLRERIMDLGSPDLLVAAWKHRAAQHQQTVPEAPQTAPAAPPAAQEPAPPTDTPPQAPAAPEASGGGSGDKTAAMTRLLAAGAAQGLKRADLDARMQSGHGVTLKQATAEQLDVLAAGL